MTLKLSSSTDSTSVIGMTLQASKDTVSNDSLQGGYLNPQSWISQEDYKYAIIVYRDPKMQNMDGQAGFYTVPKKI